LGVSYIYPLVTYRLVVYLLARCKNRRRGGVMGLRPLFKHKNGKNKLEETSCPAKFIFY